MRLIYALTALILLNIDLMAQIVVQPAEGNPVFRSLVNQEELRVAAEIEKIIGTNPFDNQAESHFNDCPPDFIGILLEAGQSIEFDLGIDTLVLGGGGNIGDNISVLNGADLVYGTVNLDTTSLVYTANSSVLGAGSDVIKLEFCRATGGCDEFEYEVTVKRIGQTIVVNSTEVEREVPYTFCLSDADINFPGEKKCAQFIDCFDTYDGEGQNLFSFVDYNRPDSCLIYYPNSFPGTDTICMVICDEFVVCDTFKIPFIVPGDTLTTGDLPLFDDFVYEGPYPTKELWLDEQVYVNRTMAPNPPSYGMATFDGVDRKGRPYDFFDGVADKLTSKAIDISTLSPSDSLTLRFFVATKGYGKAPSIKDSLVVEFRDKDGFWKLVDGYPGFLNEPFVGDTLPPFERKIYRVTDPDFFHKAFQFRFKGYSSPGGMVDLWHVDYIWFGTLPVGETGEFFDDAAFVNTPDFILDKYSSMPWWHFQGFEGQELDLPTEWTIELNNHWNLLSYIYLLLIYYYRCFELGSVNLSCFKYQLNYIGFKIIITLNIHYLNFLLIITM